MATTEAQTAEPAQIPVRPQKTPPSDRRRHLATVPIAMILDAWDIRRGGAADRHVVVLDHIGRPDQDHDAQRRGAVRRIGRAEDAQCVGSPDFDDEHDCSHQGEPEGKGAPDVAMEETRVARPLGEERKCEQVRDDQQGGVQQTQPRSKPPPPGRRAA